MKKRLLSAILSLCMIVTMLPAMVLTAGAVDDTLMSIDLKVAKWVDDYDRGEGKNFYFRDVTVANGQPVYSLTLSVDKGQISEHPGLVSGEGVIIADKGNKTILYIFNNQQNASDIEALIKKVKFKFEKGMKISITVDINPNVGFDADFPRDAKITYNAGNGHYYMYIPYTNSIPYTDSWGEAAYAAHQFVLGGRQGYLATVTTTQEFDFVNNIAGQPGWLGATALLSNEKKISISEGPINRDTLSLPEGYADTSTSAEERRQSMYWVDGPDKWKNMQDTVDPDCWSKEDEPNANNLYGNGGINESESCMMIITDAALPGLNDVYYDNVYTSADVRVVGYIVEFGYDEQEDPGGRTNQDTKVCDITLADDDSTVVIARTGHSLTFRGMPHIDYKVEKDGISYTVTERENEPGVYDVTGLDKNTTYNIDGDILFGDTTGTTLPIDAKDIAKAFDTDNTTEKDAKTDAASNSNVEVSVGEDGNYKVVVKKNINKTIEVPDTWGTVNIDLNGKTIEGAKATEGADAQPGIKFVQGDGSSHPGTDLIISNGTIKGGDGIPSHPNGAAGVTADGVTPGLTVRKDATIKGGNGADATMGNGGNGGAGISGNITTTVDGTVIGGQGGNGAPGTQPGNGGTGGAGIDSTGSTTVEPTGKVTGGQGGNGGAGNGTQGGTGGNGGAGSTGTTTNQGVINGGAGGNGGSNGGQGGNGGGAGTDDGANITNDGGTKSNGADGQINNGSLDSTTTTVIVKDPTNGLIYKIFDENGKEIEGITDAQVRTGAGEDLTFTGLTPNTWYTVKAYEKDAEGKLTQKEFAGDGKIQTKPQSSGGHHSSSTVSKNFTITATAGNGGSISPSGKTTVAEGGSKSFTITVNDGYEIADVLVDGASIGTKTSYTFEKVSASHTIEVKFRKVEQVLIVTDPSITGVANWLETDDHVVYLHGYPDRSFRPENPMTRAEAAQMFYNLLLNKDVEKTKFTDVADDAWYATAVETLASIGVIKGVGNDQFAPERAITRAEFAAIATRFAKVDDSGSVNFKDVKTGDWFYDAVETAVSYGWINGYTDSTFRPANTITRTEVSAIVNRMLARAGDTAYARMHGDVMKHFTDVTDSFWGYSNIIEATNKHDYTKTDGVESWK